MWASRRTAYGWSRDGAIGGGRRDEEKARAKERFFSHRDRFGQWDPKNQRPELWNLFNGRKNPGEHFRVFPLSNWTEMDVLQYVAAEGIEMPSLYFSHRGGRHDDRHSEPRWKTARGVSLNEAAPFVGRPWVLRA